MMLSSEKNQEKIQGNSKNSSGDNQHDNRSGRNAAQSSGPHKPILSVSTHDLASKPILPRGFYQTWLRIAAASTEKIMMHAITRATIRLVRRFRSIL
jgi:hypothetical protein